MTNIRRAFTLVELMVTIGIVVILAGILMIAVHKSMAAGRRVRAQADLQSIATALEAYKQDFGDYPRATGDMTVPSNLAYYQDGAWVLARSLVAPGPQVSARPLTADGADGVGFRVRPGGQGKVYPPYVDTDKFTILTNDDGKAADPIRYYLVDKIFASDQHPPILYIPRNIRPIKPDDAVNGYVDTNANAMYDFTYASYWAPNWPSLAGTITPLQQVRILMGIKPANVANSYITAGETPAFTGPYILWMPGPDGFFGLTNSKGARDVDTGGYMTDDIANFNFDPAITVK